MGGMDAVAEKMKGGAGGGGGTDRGRGGWGGAALRRGRPPFVVVQTLASWQNPLTRSDSRELSESGIRAVQYYDCPTAPCGSGHDPEAGRAESQTINCSGKCHARGHPSVLLEHVDD